MSISIGAPKICGARPDSVAELEDIIHSRRVGLCLIGLTLCSGCIFGGESLVLFSDLVELPHVLEEIWASLQGDEKLGLLAISLLPLHSDGSGSDLLEGGILVSKRYKWTKILSKNDLNCSKLR